MFLDIYPAIAHVRSTFPRCAAHHTAPDHAPAAHTPTRAFSGAAMALVGPTGGCVEAVEAHRVYGVWRRCHPVRLEAHRLTANRPSSSISLSQCKTRRLRSATVARRRCERSRSTALLLTEASACRGSRTRC